MKPALATRVKSQLAARVGPWLAALGGFLRGFVGLAPLGRDAASVRHALEQRAAGRKSCC